MGRFVDERARKEGMLHPIRKYPLPVMNGEAPRRMNDIHELSPHPFVPFIKIERIGRSDTVGPFFFILF